MAERVPRTPEERERARLEREARRAKRTGRAAPSEGFTPAPPARDRFVAGSDPFVPEPDPFVPEPDPFVPEPDPFVPEPDPFVPEPPAVEPPAVEPPAMEPAADPAAPPPAAPEPDPDVPAPDPFVPAPDPLTPRPESAAPEPSPSPAGAAEPDVRPARPSFAPLPQARVTETIEDAEERDEDDHDVPAGTRRVSALHRTPAGRPDPRRSQRRRPRQIHLQRRTPGSAGPPPRRRRWVRIVALLVLVLAAALIWFLVELFQPFHGSGHGRVVVRVPANASAGQIGGLLARDGVIDSSLFFRLRVDLAGDHSKLRSGTYTLKRGMTYGGVLTVLTTPPPAARTSELTLIPGKTRLQIDSLLRSQHIRGSYIAATRHSRLLDPRAYGAPRSTPDLEGFLFPDTYQLRDPISIGALVAAQLERFKQEFATVNMGAARRHHLTPYDVLVIASLIEGEAATEHDRLLVASVIYNRLRLGMPLGLDDSTQFATGNYTKPLTASQLNSSSPYNTRVHSGLPPTPIDSPSLASIQAAARPPSTTYLYFVDTPCGRGSMLFSSNYTQFENESAAFQAALHDGKSAKLCK